MRFRLLKRLLLHIEGVITARHAVSFKVGRDFRNGRFIPVRQAQRRKASAEVETITRRGM